jgi:hypothetical protein
MAAAAKTTNVAPLGITAGPESVVLVTSTNIDVDSTIDFNLLGPVEAVELTIVSAVAKTGSPSIVFTLQAKDLASGTYVDLVASAAVTDAATAYLATSHVSPAVANKVAQRIVREQMRLKIDYTGTPTTDVLNGVTVTASCV